MKVLLLLLLLVQLSLQQGWSATPLWSGSDFSVASDQNETLVVFTTPQGLNYSISPFNTTEQIRSSGTHPIVRASNWTWILTFIDNQSIIILRANRSTGPWNPVFMTGALEDEVALTSYRPGYWATGWKNAAGTLMVGFSTNDGLSWSMASYSYGRPDPAKTYLYNNFLFPSMAEGGQYGCLMALSINGTEIISQIYDGTVLLNVTGSGRPHLVSNGSTVLFLSGSGDLFISRDQGQNWSAPIEMVAGSIITDGNGTWLISGFNSTLFRSVDNAQTWTREETRMGPIDQIEGSPSKVFFLQNGTIFTSSPTTIQIIRLNQSLVITEPVIIDRSLMVEGTLSVGASLQIIGNLILTDNSTLDLTNRTLPVEVAGEFTAAGRLVIPDGTGTIILVKFNSTRGNFSQIEGSDCARVEHAESSLLVIFDSCPKSAIQLWKIILITVGSVIAVAIGTVLIVFFRQKIAPHHDRTYHTPKKQMV